jgi:hypothetical protein
VLSYVSPIPGGGGLRGLSLSVQLYTGAQINFGDLTLYFNLCLKLSEAARECRGTLMNETSRMRITVTSSVNEISMDQL